MPYPTGARPCRTQLFGGALVAIPVASADPINTVWFITAAAVGILPQRVCGPYLGGIPIGRCVYRAYHVDNWPEWDLDYALRPPRLAINLFVTNVSNKLERLVIARIIRANVLSPILFPNLR